ncbi:MAG: hypothetical protein WCO98_17225 [bacterium]
MIFDNILNFSITVIFLVLMVQYTARFFHVYKLGEKSFTAGLLIFPLITIYYDDIEEVKSFGITDFNIFGGNINFFSTNYYQNKIWGRKVVITKKHGRFFKYLVITPDEPKKFIEEINERIEKAKGEIC